MVYQIDPSIFGQIKTLQDFQRADEEFRLAKQLQQAKIAQAAQESKMGGSNLPAALRLANEYRMARESGDVQRMNDIEQFAKTIDKGVISSPEGGFTAAPGYAQAVGDIAGFKKGAERQSAKDVDLVMDPEIKKEVVKSEIGARAETEAKIGLPKAEAQAKQALDLIDSIEKDKGMSAVIGMPEISGGRIPFKGNVWGSPAADFQAKLDQLGGKQFLEAFESLKGGGAITQIEGDKATNAIGRMQTAQSEKAFIQALGELKEVISTGVERQRKMAAGTRDAIEEPLTSPQETVKVTSESADPYQKARDAIKKGADLNMVYKRLIDNGLDPRKL